MILLDNEDILVKRLDAGRKPLSILQDVYVERGTKADWDLLHELHYKAESLGIGPTIYRATLYGQTIGVGVMTVPKMLCAGRNEVFKHMRPNSGGMDTKTINTHRARQINANTCINSRLVLDTMYRGAGIAYRMQNIMMRMSGKRVIEFQSSMSKFNPFAAKAGVRFTAPKRASNYERGLKWFRRWFRANPSDFIGIMREINSWPMPVQKKCIEEMRKFYYACSSMEKCGNNRFNGTSRVEGMEVGYLLKSLQQLILASPLYGVYENPDFDRELPSRISIMAFDNQGVDEPLDLEML